MWRGLRQGAVVVCVMAALGVAAPVEAASLLEVRAKGGELLPEGLFERVKALPHVVRVERYLYVSAEPHDVIGIEPGSPARIVTKQGELLQARIETGRGFKEGDKNAAIVGKVYREDYGFRGTGGMGGMMHHPFEVGASFSFPGSTERIRVIGTFAVDPDPEAKRVLLPLATAQRLLDRAGKVSHLFIAVDAAENADRVAEAIRSTAGEVEIIRR